MVRARPRPLWTPTGADIRPWLARAGALRARSSDYGETLLVREALGRRPLLRVVQSPANTYPTWEGLPFADGKPPTVPLACMIIDVAGREPGRSGTGPRRVARRHRP